MRPAVIAALLLAAGCHDYNILKQSFCDGPPRPFLLCDDFDQPGIVDAKRWQSDVTNGAAAEPLALRSTSSDMATLPIYSPSVAFRGPGALGIYTPQFGHAQLIDTVVTKQVTSAAQGTPPTSTYFAVRFWLNQSANSLPGTSNIISLADRDGKERFSVDSVDGYLVATDRVTGSRAPTGEQLPFGAWLCIELRIGKALSLWSDASSDTPFLVLADIPSPPALSATRLGLARGADDEFPSGASLWIDEVVIDDQPIGCF